MKMPIGSPLSVVVLTLFLCGLKSSSYVWMGLRCLEFYWIFSVDFGHLKSLCLYTLDSCIILVLRLDLNHYRIKWWSGQTAYWFNLFVQYFFLLLSHILNDRKFYCNGSNGCV